MADIREADTVDTYNGAHFELWKMKEFQSREWISIVNGAVKKSDMTSNAERLQWEKHDKMVIVVILWTIDSAHKVEVIDYLATDEMWSQLHICMPRSTLRSLYQCAPREVLYLQMGDKDSIAMCISTLQKLAKQLTDLRQKVNEQQLISKIKCGLLSSFDPLLLAWDSVPIVDQILNTLQTRLVKFWNKMKQHEVEASTQWRGISHQDSWQVKQINIDNVAEKTRAERLAKLKRHSRCYRFWLKMLFRQGLPTNWITLLSLPKRDDTTSL